MKKYLITGVSLLIIILIAAVIFIPTSSSAKITSIDTQTFNNEFLSKDTTLLDIRTIDEFNQGHIKGAKEIDYYQTQSFSDYLDSLDKTKKYLIYCNTGRRTGLALQIFKDKGFTNVSDLSGGYTAWQAAGLPTEK